MNQMPTDWTDQIKAAYPKRSGPCGWGGVRLMLAVRKALLETDWDTIMKGVQGYAKFCQEAGTEGSGFVKTPQNFFEEAIYLEELAFQAPLSKEEKARAEIKAKEESRWAAARALGEQTGARGPYPQECIAAFETRIRLAQSGMGGRASMQRPCEERGGEPKLSHNGVASNVAIRITDLANRLKRA